MRGTLKDQLMAAVQSGKIEVPKEKAKTANARPNNNPQIKLKTSFEKPDVLFIKTWQWKDENNLWTV